jgi:hypothetical protein
MRSGNRQLFVNQNDQPDEHHDDGVAVVAGDDGVVEGVVDGLVDGVEMAWRSALPDVEEMPKKSYKTT